MAAGAGAAETYIIGSPPSDPNNLVLWESWSTPVQYNELPPVDCQSAAAETASQCRFTYTLPATVPAGATHVLLRVKAKAQLPTASATGVEKNVLIYAATQNPNVSYPNNHFIHTEVHGDGSNGQQIRRNVKFADIIAPIFDGKVYINVGKRILVGGEVEIAIYLEGYLM